MKIFSCERSEFQEWYPVHNKQLMLTAPTVHYTPPFCIAKCSVNLVDLTVVEHELELVPDDEQGCELRTKLCCKSQNLTAVQKN